MDVSFSSSAVYIDAREQLLFCLPAKSGSTIASLLLKQLFKEIALKPLRTHPDPDILSSYFKVALLREPLSRLAATYTYKIANKSAAAIRGLGLSGGKLSYSDFLLQV